MDNEKDKDQDRDQDERLRKIVRSEFETLVEVLDSRLTKYKLPKGYDTCPKCGTIYPGDMFCPRCRSEEYGEVIKAEEERTEEERTEEERTEEESDDDFI